MQLNALAGSESVPTPSDQAQNDQPQEQAPTAQTEAEATPAEESEQPSSEGSETPETKKANRKASERISELTRQRNDAEIRAHVAEQRLRQLSRPLQVRENMTDLQRQAVELRQADREADAEEAREALNEARSEARSTRFEVFSEKVGNPEVVEAFCKLPRVSEELADLVAESDKAAELASWLSKNPAEARRLSSMPPHRLGAELARKEASFTAPQVRRVSQAPEPSPTLRGGSNPPAFDANTASVASLQAALKKQGVLR